MTRYTELEDQIEAENRRAEFCLRRGCMCRIWNNDPPCDAWRMTLRCETTRRIAVSVFGLEPTRLELDENA